MDPTVTRILSKREKECLRLVYGRRTTKEIAKTLGLSPGTVGTYIADAVAKMGAGNRREAAEWLHGLEAPTPQKIGSVSEGVETEPLLPPTTWRDRWRIVRRSLPIRLNGASHNDLSLSARNLWTVGIAFALAVGFGMLAVGADAVSDLIRIIRY